MSPDVYGSLQLPWEPAESHFPVVQLTILSLKTRLAGNGSCDSNKLFKFLILSIIIIIIVMMMMSV